MAQTAGIVQRLSVFTDVGNLLACAWLGPTPTSNELFVVRHDGSAADLAFATGAVQALTAASANYRPVVVTHGNSDGIVSAVSIESV